MIVARILVVIGHRLRVRTPYAIHAIYDTTILFFHPPPADGERQYISSKCQFCSKPAN